MTHPPSQLTASIARSSRVVAQPQQRCIWKGNVKQQLDGSTNHLLQSELFAIEPIAADCCWWIDIGDDMLDTFLAFLFIR